MGAQRVRVFISRFPKVHAFRRDSHHGSLGAVAGELGTPSRLLLRAESPASPPADFQTLTGEILKTNTLEIKCAHIYTYLWTQESNKPWDCGMAVAEICIPVP